MAGKVLSALSGDCENCGAPSDVCVAGALYCAKCALESHFADLQREESSPHAVGESVEEPASKSTAVRLVDSGLTDAAQQRHETTFTERRVQDRRTRGRPHFPERRSGFDRRVNGKHGSVVYDSMKRT